MASPEERSVVELARVLKQVRDKYCGGSQRELARRIGLGEFTVRRLIQALNDPAGVPNPSADTLHRIWAYLKDLDEYRGLREETVHMWAGHLPPPPEREARLRELAELLEGLPERDKQEIVEFARMKARLAAERK